MSFMAGTEEITTNLVVMVPEADPALEIANGSAPPDERLRAPAHITLVYPFIPPATAVDRADELASFFADQEPLTFELEVGWFGREVLLLRPNPEVGLVKLTEAVNARWPEYPYYGGTYDVIEPHLSLGFGTETTLAPVADAVAAITPLTVKVDAVTLLVGPHENMQPGPSFRLGR